MDFSNPTFTTSSKASLLPGNDVVSSLRRRNKTLILIFFSLIFILALIIGAVIIYLVSQSHSQSLADSNPALNSFCSHSYFPSCVASLFPQISTRPDLNPNQVFAISLEASREKLSRIISMASDGAMPEPALRNCSRSAGRAIGRIVNAMEAIRVEPCLETQSYERMGDVRAWIEAAADDLAACVVESRDVNGLGKSVEEVRGLLGYGREYVINCEGVNDDFFLYGNMRHVDESWRNNRMVEDLVGVSLFGSQYFVLLFLFCLLVRNY